MLRKLLKRNGKKEGGKKATNMQMESVRKAGVVFKKERKVHRKGKCFTKPKSIITIERQRESETGEIDKGGKLLNIEEIAEEMKRWE